MNRKYSLSGGVLQGIERYSLPVMVPVMVPQASSCQQQKSCWLKISSSAREQLLKPRYLPDSIELFKALLLMAFNR